MFESGFDGLDPRYCPVVAPITASFSTASFSTARDSSILPDRNTVGIDFDGNALSGYDFTVGITNSRQDGIISNQKERKIDWDGAWYSQTSQGENYWYTEILIPWSVAPMSGAANIDKTMRFYFSRVVYEESLQFSSPYASAERPTFLSDWQPVSVKQQAGSSLDWLPYIAGAHTSHRCCARSP
jgi:hypothetical protein